MAAVDELGESEFRALGLDAVAGQGFLARLTEAQIEELVQSAHSAWYPAGVLLAPPRVKSGPALVVAGRLRYFLAAPDGRQLTVAYNTPGDLIGTVVRDTKTLSARFEVMQPTTLVHLDENHVMTLLAARPALALAMLDESSSCLRRAYDLLAGRAFTNVRVRVARDLWERARTDGCVKVGQHLDVTHQSLADATGTVREVVARTIRDLRHEGVLATDPAGVTILDPDALAGAACL